MFNELFVKNHYKIILVFAFFSLSIFFFILGPSDYSHRLIKEFWNLGHILYFAILIFIILKEINWIKRQTFRNQLIFCLLITFFFSIIIEGIQFFIDRDADIGDVRKNFIGCIFTLSFFYKNLFFNKKIVKFLQVLVVILVLFESRSFLSIFFDEIVASEQFPILSDFETPFEKKRWQGNSEFSVDHKIIRNGNSSLKVNLNTNKYSNILLKYFPGDWSAYNYLSFSVFNTNLTPMKIYCRVYDNQHIKNGYGYTDRFNKKLEISAGWNDITISMEEIEHAPKNRLMNIKEVKDFCIFVTNLEKPVTIYIDNVKLN